MSDTMFSAPRPIQKLGRYELVELLAQGGMGEVHLAKLAGAAGFEKLCIVKTVLPALLKDPQFMERFAHEAKVLVHLSHANIAQVYDMGESDGVTYIALEFVPGVDLAALEDALHRAGEPLPVPAALYIGQKLAEGLGYAHRKAGPDGNPLRIVHRDVSPQNVMVSYEGEVKIIDFGLAKSATRRQTQAPTVMGKLGYMSPEQARAEVVDSRSDIFSAGVVVWEMLAGRALVPQGSAGEMLAAMASPRIPPLAPLRADLPQGLEVAVLRALNARKEERYASADDFAAALAEVALRTTGLLAPARMGQFVRASCRESFESHRRLISRLSTLKSADAAPTALEMAPTAQRAAVTPAAAVAPAAVSPPTKRGVSTATIVLGVIGGLTLFGCLALGLLGSALRGSTPVAGSFKASYGKAKQPLNAQLISRFRESKVLDSMAAALNSEIRLPRDITFIIEECGKVNAFYNPRELRIHLCTELITFFETTFRQLNPKESSEQISRAVSAFVTFSLIHEVGHALIHVLQLPTLGREEDAADGLATLVYSISPDGGEAGLLAAEGLAALDVSNDVRRLPLWDEHSLGRVRFYNVVCLLYGAHPAKFKTVAARLFPPERLGRCEQDYRKLNLDWQKELGPYLARPLPIPSR